MRVGVGDLARTPHEVLEVLPADPAAEVLHDDPVLGAGGRPVLVQPHRPVAAAVSGRAVALAAAGARPPAVAAAAPAVLVAAVRRALGQLAGDAVPEEVSTVEVVYRVLGVAVVLELYEGVPGIKSIKHKRCFSSNFCPRPLNCISDQVIILGFTL